MSTERSWKVVLLGGASGVGKSSVSYRLAHHYGIGLTEVDDFQVILEGMTTADQYPVVHYWRTNYEEARNMSGEQHVTFFRQYSEVMAKAPTLVIANHIETQVPVVLEGDFILPSLATLSAYGEVPAADGVRAVFLYEEDADQIAHNYLLRDGVPQPERARISWLVSEWLRWEANRVGVPAIPARPWETVLERAIEALHLPPSIRVEG